LRFTLIDWLLLCAPLLISVAAVWKIRGMSRSVTDFLAADRCAGRYLLCVGDGMAGLGLITIVAAFEMFYNAGFTAAWWSLMTSPASLIIALSGWVVYRFRKTRSLTLAQFFETRYSRRFRVFAGILAWLAGIINFAIFPSVGARFFIEYLGLPHVFFIAGLPIDTYTLLIVSLVGLALSLVFSAGQVAVMVVDFLLGVLTFGVLIALLVLFAWKMDWHDMMGVLQTAPPGQSLVVPTDSGGHGFNMWFFLINLLMAFYTTMAWQGSQGFDAAARTPHEARMAGILAEWRKVLIGTVMTLIPVAVWAMLHSPGVFGFTDSAVVVTQQLETIRDVSGPAIQTQMTVPVALSHILPIGMLGAFAAMMLGAFLTTHNTYMHSWGSIFVQDVVLPIRRGFGLPDVSPTRHIWYLRISIVAVAVFICAFSLLFTQRDFIRMFQVLTGSVYMAGAGAVIIGGLYWRGGTTRAAWAALLTGALFAGAGLAAQQVWPAHLYPYLQLNTPSALAAVTLTLNGLSDLLPGINWHVKQDRFPIDSIWLSFFSMVASVIAYVGVSWMDRMIARTPRFDLSKLYGDQADRDAAMAVGSTLRSRLATILPNSEFTPGDRAIYWTQLAWSLGLFVIFVVGTALGALGLLEFEHWATFWHWKIGVSIILAIATGVWFSVAGFCDLGYMFRTLRVANRDSTDNGQHRVVPVSTDEPAPANDSVDIRLLASSSKTPEASPPRG